MVERQRWRCPKCGRRWDIPVGHNPTECPKCKQSASASAKTVQTSPLAHAAVAEFEEFVQRFDASTQHTSGQKRPPSADGQSEHSIERDVATNRSSIRPPADFFAPVSNQSLVAGPGSKPRPSGRYTRPMHQAIVTAAICIVGILAFGGLLMSGLVSPQSLVSTVLFASLGIFGLFVYGLPTIIAFGSKHHNAPAICVLNVFLGWTFLGWVIALVWSCTDRGRDRPTVIN